MDEGAGADAGSKAARPRRAHVQHLSSKRAEGYGKLAAKLKAEAASSDGVAPWFGAASKADKTTQREDTDRVEPAFARHQFSTPGNALTAETGGLSTL